MEGKAVSLKVAQGKIGENRDRHPLFYVGGTPTLAPDGTYVGGTPYLAPDGSYVGGGEED